MPRKPTSVTVQLALDTHFIGKTITGMELSEDGLTITTEAGTLRAYATRFEQLGATLGRACTEEMSQEEAFTFMNGKTILRSEQDKGSTIITFTNGERLVIGAEPNIEFDTMATYTATRISEEELV